MTGFAQPASPLSVSSVAQLTLSLIAVLALIFAISWALKRLKLAGPRGRGEISVVDEIALGPRERVVLLRVGRSQVLVGVGSGGVVGLVPLAEPLVEGGPPPATPFAQRLREFMGRSGGVS